MIGVSKAYITRVGGGPFPTEIHDEVGERIREIGREFGAVTGRPRRCGWFDVPLLRYTAMINGFDSMVVTKLDVLDHLDEIPVCVEYRCCGRTLNDMPATTREIEAIEPVYERLPGWSTPTAGISQYDDLPAKAREYLEFLESRTGVEVGCISTGPERNQTIVRRGSRLEKLIADHRYWARERHTTQLSRSLGVRGPSRFLRRGAPLTILYRRTLPHLAGWPAIAAISATPASPAILSSAAPPRLKPGRIKRTR